MKLSLLLPSHGVKLLACALVFLVLFTSCAPDNATGLDTDLEEQLENQLNNNGGISAFRMPESNDLESIPQDPNNPLNSVKVVLGKQLFHETAIGTAPMVASAIGTFSCASCHFAEGGFQAKRFQGIGEGGEGFFSRERSFTHSPEELDVQPIRSPTAMNGAYQDVMLWNGQFGATGTNRGTNNRWTPGTPIANNELGFQGLETQAIAGLGVHRMRIDAEQLIALGYGNLFAAAFPERAEEEQITLETAALAIAAYERTLLANRSPWQLWLRGNREVLSEQEMRGAILFLGKAGCVSCHNGPSLASMSFHAIGMEDLDRHPEQTFGTRPDNKENLGRGGFTGNPEDNYKFKTPQLYNLTDSPFYGHGASFFSVRDVIAYKNEGIPQNDRVPANALNTGFRPLGLTENEIDELTVFIEQSLYDPNLNRYVPAAVLSGSCFPNMDEQSMVDLSCN